MAASRKVDTQLHQAMRMVAEALQKDGEDIPQAAFLGYLHSLNFIVQCLVQDADQHGFAVSPNTKKFIKMGQDCMDRLGCIADSHVTDTPVPTEQVNPPVVLASAKPVAPTSMAIPASPAPYVSKHPGLANNTASVKQPTQQNMNKRKRTHLEAAYQENQTLMSAYKARMAHQQLTRESSVTLNLTMQRKLAENMAIAKAREQALYRKMQNRHARLQEQVARRFTSTAGMTKDEQERRHLYMKILEYERDQKWPIVWRDRLKLHPTDIMLFQELVKKILSIADHPLTEIMLHYQGKLQRRIEPLISNYVGELSDIMVPFTLTEKVRKRLAKSLLRPAGNGNRSEEEDDGASGAVLPSSGYTEGAKHASPDAEPDIESREKILSESGTANSSSQPPEQGNPAQTTDGKNSDSSPKQDGDTDCQTDATKPATPQVLTPSEVKHLMQYSVPESYYLDDMDDLFDPDSGFEILEDFSPDSEQGRKIQELTIDAFQRHAHIIAKDVRDYLEKIQAMFIVAYEELDSPEGRDVCYACLEEPFFRSLWKHLLAVFRLGNKEKEELIAVTMTKHSSCIPRDLRVPEPLWLEAVIPTSYSYPYEMAVNELKRLPEMYCPLSKLECIVNVSKLICYCVEKHYKESWGNQKQAPAIGADDLLPILTYVVIKSGIPQIISECHAMEEFIHEGYLMGEEGYCLTTLQTCLGFVIKMADLKNDEE